MPTSADDVFFDGASGAVTVTVTATANALSLNFTGFTGTIAGSSAIQVHAGGVTLAATMTCTHTGTLIANASGGSWTSNGKQWSGNMNISTSFTVTYVDNWDCVGNWSNGGTSVPQGSTITVRGNLSINALGVASTTDFILAGTGTWTAADDAGTSDYTINTAGTITLGTINLRQGTRVLTYTAGTVNPAASTVSISSMNVTLNLNGMSFNNLGLFTISGTLSSNIDVNGNFNVGQLGQTTTLTGGTITVGGNFTVGGSTSIVNGTTNIVLDGTGIWSSTQVSTGRIILNITINTAGTITLSGNLYYRTGTITYTAGTVNPGTSTLNVETGGMTFNTNGMNWYNIIFSGTQTITLNSRLTLTNDLRYALGSVINMSGIDAWTVARFYILTSNNVSHTLLASKEYIVTTYFESITTTSSLKDSLISSIPGTKAIFTLNYSGTQNVGYTNAVDIDSSRGQTIWTFNGVVTTTFNWNVFTSNGSNQKSYIM